MKVRVGRTSAPRRAAHAEHVVLAGAPPMHARRRNGRDRPQSNEFGHSPRTRLHVRSVRESNGRVLAFCLHVASAALQRKLKSSRRRRTFGSRPKADSSVDTA